MFNREINYLFRKIYYIFNVSQYGYLSSSAAIQKLLRVDGKKNIYIKAGVQVQRGTWLAAMPYTNAPKCNLIIEEGCIIGNFNHIYATGEIVIGKKVLTADKVFISDNQHNYVDVETPILEQSIKQFPPMKIGEGSWIGENVCIIGVSIGKHCVIGANSVVNKPVPDYCVAVGAPAKIIKKYNFETRKWERA